MADLTQTAANVGLTDQSGARIRVVKAGEAITQGMPVYVNDAEYYQCDASALASAACAGIAMTPAADGEYFAMAGDDTTVDLGGTLTIGETYCVSATKGAIAPIADLSSGEFVTILGTATAADELKLQLIIGTVAKA